MHETWSHKYVSVRRLRANNGWFKRGGIICVTAGLSHLRGNARPYFSVTADIAYSRAHSPRGCGCMHDEVLKYWPTLAPVVALHLCDDTGMPMHAEANGWYSLAGYYRTDDTYHAGNSPRQIYKDGVYIGHRLPTPDECLAQFAEHVRVSVDDARTLAQTWECREDWHASRRWFGEWLTTQTERYATEARNACALLDTLIARRAPSVAE